MLGRWIARRHMQRARIARLPVASDAAQGRSEAPDLAARRSFLNRHILIHTHIPKTGGSALAGGLSAIVGGVHAMDTRLRRSVPLADMSAADRDDLHLVSGHFGFGMHVLFQRRPLYIAALRSPIDRAVSLYRYMVDQPEQPENAYVRGLSFGDAWQAMDDQYGEKRRNLQARYLTGATDGSKIDEHLLWHQVAEGYFLLLPQDKITDAVQQLRAAFGVAWTRVPRVNVSRSAQVEPDTETRRRIEGVDALDCQLYDRVVAEFPENMRRAADYIASHCLQPLKGAADREDET